MKLKVYHFIIFAILLIPPSAYFDAIIIEKTNFAGYLYICSLEALIFISGLLFGYYYFQQQKQEGSSE